MGQEAVSLLDRMPGTKVLCIGDLMLDRYIYGDASRISPEAPVPVVHVKRQVMIPGGVGNVVANLAAFGIVPIAVGLVGDDANADALSGFLAGCGCGGLMLIRDPERPTIVKTRIIAGIQQVVRFDDEHLAPAPDSAVDKMLDMVKRSIGDVGAVALSDYGKGVLTPTLTQGIIAVANAAGKPVIIDPKGHDYSKYAGATMVKPNRKELGDAVGHAIADDAEVAGAGRGLMRRHNIHNLLITLSEKGMMLLRGADAGETPVMFPSKAREVYDVTGAGDTVLACMASSLAVGAPAELGARLATLAAGVVVGKVGTAVASRQDIVKAGLEYENIGG